MIKTVLKIDGMACGMCEAHVNDAIRKAFAVKRVTSSHSKGKTEILTEAPIDNYKLRNAIEQTGYKVLSIHTETDTKKRCSLFKK